MYARLRHDVRRPSVVLSELAESLPDEGLTLREIIERIGEQGLLLASVLMAVPFLLPVSIPGSSGPFGVLIALIGIGIALNRVPWLPRFLMERRLGARRLRTVLVRGARLLGRIEKLIRPRLLVLTQSATTNRFNGAALAVGGVLLTAPLPLPFTNTFPGWACVLLSMGILHRDGVVVAAGYGMLLASVVYFAALAVGVWWMGWEVGGWFERGS